MNRMNTPVHALLVIAGWHGTTATPVLLVGSTPKRFCIRAITRTRLAGRGRYLEPGKEALVPLTAVRVTGPVADRKGHSSEGKVK